MKHVTIFVNGTQTGFAFEASVEANLVAFLDGCISRSDATVATWRGSGLHGEETLSLISSRVGGYYIRNLPEPTKSAGEKAVEILERMSKDDSEEWKDS